MQKLFAMFVLFAWMAGAAFADSLYLQDGKVVKGTFLGFEDGQFIFETSDGSQVKYPVRRVQRLEVDRDLRSTDTRPRRLPRRGASDSDSGGSSDRRWQTSPPFDVRLEDQWIRSQIQVYKGQRVRVEASGTVTLEKQTYVSPEGLRNKRDVSAPMPEENDGALIAVIGKDPDAPLILIGRQLEFIADRDGMLYFTLNHGETRNSGGAFRVNVSVNRLDQGSIDAGTGQTAANQKTVTVPGNQAWIDTGINLESEASLEIDADGQISIDGMRTTGPDGDRNAVDSSARYPIQNSGVGALIWKIRYLKGMDSRNFYAGARQRVKTGKTEAGRLYLGINDNYLRDNGGSYRVTIRWR